MNWIDTLSRETLEKEFYIMFNERQDAAMECNRLRRELDNVAPYYMDALDRERELAEENEFLKESLLEIYDLQMHQTQEMWTLINQLFDRSDPRNPIPRGSD